MAVTGCFVQFVKFGSAHSAKLQLPYFSMTEDSNSAQTPLSKPSLSYLN